MNDKCKGRVQGIVAGILVGTAITGSFAFARANIRVVVDGKEAVMTDAEGNYVEAFEENGVAYIPLRGVSQILGKNVSWDGPTQTAYIGNMNGTLSNSYISLSELTDIGIDKGWWKDNAIDNYENKYIKSLYFNYNENEDEFLLDGKYSYLRGSIYVGNGSSTSKEALITISADGTVLKEIKLDKTSKPEILDLNVSGYNDLKIVTSIPRSMDCYLGDPKLYQ